MERKQMHIMAYRCPYRRYGADLRQGLAKHAVMGDKITTVAMTAGERGCPPGYTRRSFGRKT